MKPEERIIVENNSSEYMRLMKSSAGKRPERYSPTAEIPRMHSLVLNPTSCSNRHQEHDAVYHIYNRVAHSVRFLGQDEKDDLMDRFRRIAEFCGIRLLSWCLMTNHFHLLVYLPEPRELSVDELKYRVSLLKPEERVVFEAGFTLNRAPHEIIKRMYNIGMFMKIVKENFTIAYNARTGHHGTMWEGPYRFKRVPMSTEDMTAVAAYQNLNPIRACMAFDFAEYQWTSFAAAEAGDEVALSGLDFIFGGYEHRTDAKHARIADADDLLARMREKMNCALKMHQREMAESVWRRRLAGEADAAVDSLTSEAMVAQVEETMNQLRTNKFRKELAARLGRMPKDDELDIIRAMAADPTAKVSDLAKSSSASLSRVKRISRLLQKLGAVVRLGSRRQSVWRVLIAENAIFAA